MSNGLLGVILSFVASSNYAYSFKLVTANPGSKTKEKFVLNNSWPIIVRVEAKLNIAIRAL